MSDKYQFTEAPGKPAGFIRLRWKKNGKDHPLNFWQVPPEVGVEKAKERVRAGEFD